MSTIVKEHELVVWARTAISREVEGAAKVKAALAVAEVVKGLVLTNEAEAVMATDSARTVATGRRALEDAKKKVLEVPRAMVAVVNDAARTPSEILERAAKEINNAQLAYIRRQREAEAKAQRERQAAFEAAAAEERKRREEAASETRRLLAGAPAAAVEAAVQAAQESVDEVVPLEEPAAPVVTQIRGGAGMAVTTKRLCAEIVSLADVDPVLVELRQKDACDVARREIRRENMPEPGIGRENGAVMGGIRYFYVESISNRSAL